MSVVQTKMTAVLVAATNYYGSHTALVFEQIANFKFMTIPINGKWAVCRRLLELLSDQLVPSRL